MPFPEKVRSTAELADALAAERRRLTATATNLRAVATAILEPMTASTVALGVPQTTVGPHVEQVALRMRVLADELADSVLTINDALHGIDVVQAHARRFMEKGGL